MFGLGINNLGGNNDEALAVAQGIISSRSSGYYNPNDFSGLFQDSGGTIPVTSVGDPVGLMLDTRRIRQYADNVLVLDGASGDYASTPDSAAASITGDIDIRVKVALDDWVAALAQTFVGKYNTVTNSRSYLFRVLDSGKLRLNISGDGTSFAGADSSVAPTVSDGDTLWVRATWSDSGNVANFYTSTDDTDDPSEVSWSALGASDVALSQSGIFDNSDPVEIGSFNSGTSELAAGKIFRAAIYNGIDGTLAVDFNPQDKTSDGDSWVSAETGETWTQNGTARVVPDWSNYALQKTAGSRPLLGIRPKAGVRNQNQYTRSFENSYWSKFGVTVEDQVDGEYTKLRETGATSSHVVFADTYVVSGVEYVSYIDAKPDEQDWVQVTVRSAGFDEANVYANFNVATGSVGSVGSGCTASIVQSPDDPAAYRCIIVATADADVSSSGGVSIALTNNADIANRQPNYTGTSGEGVLIARPQFARGSTATAYQRKTANGFCWEDTRTRVNLFDYSEEFDNAYWSKLRVSVTANAIAAPDGTITADKIVEDTSSSTTHIFLPAADLSLPAGSYTASVYLKEAERRYAGLQICVDRTSQNRRYSVLIDLQDGSFVDDESVASPSGTAYQITSVGDGWYRLDVTSTHTTGDVSVFVFMNNDATPAWNAGNPEYTGDGASGVYVWGAQLNSGSTATAYQPVYGDWFNTLSDLAPLFSSHITRLIPDGVDDFMTIPGSASTFKFLHDGTGGSAFSASQFGFEDNSNALYTLFASRALSTDDGLAITYDDRNSTSSNDRLYPILSNGSVADISNVKSANGTMPANEPLIVGYSLLEQTGSDLFGYIDGDEVLDSNITGTPSTAISTYDVNLFRFPNATFYMEGALESLLIVGNVPSSSSQQFLTKYLANQSGITL